MNLFRYFHYTTKLDAWCLSLSENFIDLTDEEETSKV